MECFTHPSQQAVAICKSCGRAVCRSCAEDLTIAVVCSEACGIEATQLHEMNKRGKRLYGIGTNKRHVPMGPLMWGSFALLFEGLAFFRWLEHGNVEWFLVLFGLIAAILAVVSYRRMKDLELNC